MLEHAHTPKLTITLAECGDLNSLFKILRKLQGLPSYCIIRGQASAETPELVVRKKELFPEPEEGCSWAMLDIDGVEAPPGVDPCSRDAVEYVTTLLPPEFREVSYVAALSNSAGIRKPDGELFKPGIRVHLFYLLNHPVQGPLLAAWLEQHCYNAYFYTVGPNSGNIPMVTPGIDPAPLRSSVQIHYTAAPILGEEVICDVPPEGRIWLQKKGADSVQVPEIEPTLPHDVKERRNEIRRNWAVENGYRLENRQVRIGASRYSSERLVPENPSEIRMGRELIRTDLRANGNVLGLVLADEKTPNSWYVVKSRPWLARRMGDDVEIPLEEFCPAALQEVQKLWWIHEITTAPDEDDPKNGDTAGTLVSALSEPPSGMVRLDRESYLRNLFLRNWGSDYVYGSGYVQITVGDPPNTTWQKVFSFFYVYAKVRTDRHNNWSFILHVLRPDGGWSEVIVPAQDLYDGNKALMELATHGVEIYSAGKKHLVRYILEYPCDRIERLVDRTGWSEDGQSFVLPQQTISNDPNGNGGELYLARSAQGLIEGIRSSGTLNEWQEAVAQLCLGNSRLEMALFLAFLPPLMKPLNHPTFGVHFWGTSSLGKSASMQVAASVWGKPSQVYHQWRTTDNGLEGLAYAHSDILLLLDEIRQANAQIVRDAAFMLGNEKRKARANREGDLRAIKRWRLAYLSNGERSSTDFVREGGIEVMGGFSVRLLDIPIDGGAGMGAIENLCGYPTPNELINAIETNSNAFYGDAAVAFIQGLFLRVTSDELIERYNAFKPFFMDKLPAVERNTEMLRILQRFTIIAFAGELAIEFGVLPYESGQAICTMVRIATEHESARGGSEPLDILERMGFIKREISRNRCSNFKRLNKAHSSFFEGGGYDPRIFWGYSIYPNSDSDQILEFRIPRALFKDVFCHGVNPKALINALRDRDCLSEDNHKIGKRRERCYVIPYAFVAEGEVEFDEQGEDNDRLSRQLDQLRNL